MKYAPYTKNPSPLQIIHNYPPLFHYTRSNSLKDLLESKSLLTRPTWDFSDSEEYRHGLKLIRQELSITRASESGKTKVAEWLREVYGQLDLNPQSVLDAIIDNMTYELENSSNPRVKVYIACLSQDPTSVKMIRSYGECVIAFNFVLPLLAYSYPSPFTSSMLSRVSYDENEFRSHVLKQFFHIGHPEDLSRQTDILKSAPSNHRPELLAGWLTEQLCLFAPNVKRPEYSFEREWRLKSSISDFSLDSNTARRPRLDALLGLPKVATFLDAEKNRYFHRLTFLEKFISQGIMIFSNQGLELSSWVSDWQSRESMPILGIEEFSRAYLSQ